MKSMITLKAHFDGKTLVPDEPVDLPQGQPLLLHVESQASAGPHAVTEEGNGQSAAEWMIENAVDDPSLPTDGARQHDHYLYGTPKRP
jgi:hypothetical protein